MDYIEGFYTGSEKRMDNALHPELSKRIMNAGTGKLRNMTKETLVNITTNKKSEEPDKGKMKAKESIYDIFYSSAFSLIRIVPHRMDHLIKRMVKV